MNPPRPRFALIGHPADLPLFRAYIRFLKPGKTFRDELILKLFEWTPPYKAVSWSGISLDGKKSADGILVMVPFLPEMRDISLKTVVEKVEKAVAIAAGEGCGVAALGAFTSIVLQGKEEEIGRRHGIILTSGNTTTAALIVRSLEELARHFNRPLSGETAAVIGASGDIGMGVTLWLGTRAKKLILTARNHEMLRQAVAPFRKCLTCEIETSSDNAYAVKHAGVAVFVTSAYCPLFHQEDFNPGAIVCDASAPLNVGVSGRQRPDIFLYHGGIAQLPCRLDPEFDIGLASPDHLYGCMTEGLLMAFNPELPPSLGRGNITADKIRRYGAELARYAIAPAYSCGKKIIKSPSSAT
jgi:fatty aldehyde-generating acyl-ACP reductase